MEDSEHAAPGTQPPSANELDRLRTRCAQLERENASLRRSGLLGRVAAALLGGFGTVLPRVLLSQPLHESTVRLLRELRVAFRSGQFASDSLTNAVDSFLAAVLNRVLRVSLVWLVVALLPGTVLLLQLWLLWAQKEMMAKQNEILSVQTTSLEAQTKAVDNQVKLAFADTTYSIRARLADPNLPVSTAVGSIERLGLDVPEMVVYGVSPLLEDSNARVAEAALQALGRLLVSRTVAPRVVSALGERSGPIQAIAQVLHPELNLERQEPSELARNFEDNLRATRCRLLTLECMRRSPELANAVIEAAAQIALSETVGSPAKQFAIDTLGWVRSPELKARALQDVLFPLLDRAEHPENVVSAIGQLGRPAIHGLLLRIGDREMASDLRLRSAQALGRVGLESETAVGELLSSDRTDLVWLGVWAAGELTVRIPGRAREILIMFQQLQQSPIVARSERLRNLVGAWISAIPQQGESQNFRMRMLPTPNPADLPAE